MRPDVGRSFSHKITNWEDVVKASMIAALTEDCALLVPILETASSQHHAKRIVESIVLPTITADFCWQSLLSLARCGYVCMTPRDVDSRSPNFSTYARSFS